MKFLATLAYSFILMISLTPVWGQPRDVQRQIQAMGYQEFLEQSMPARFGSLPSGYLPEYTEFTAGATFGNEQFVLDGSWDVTLFEILLVGAAADISVPTTNSDFAMAAEFRGMVQVLNRVGVTTSSSLGLGGFFSGRLGEDGSGDFWESGSLLYGPFLAYDILVPEWRNTQYGVYLGRDSFRVRAGWYPLWDVVGTAFAVYTSVGSKFEEGRSSATAGLLFSPVDTARIAVETTNFSRLRLALTLLY
jgi:hypothetical protein